MRHPLVMGNWKLNGSTGMISTFIPALLAKLSEMKKCNLVIAPPLVYLHQVRSLLAGSVIRLGAQNVDIHPAGAFTGEISAEMLKDIGAKYIIIGHSERRSHHRESDEIIAKKFALLKAQDLIPVLCIGESEVENQAGETQGVCAKQLDAVLKTSGDKAFENAVIAYEPLWAIGSGKSATPAEAQRVHKFIRGHIAQKDANSAEKVVIQYGGSVSPANAAELFEQPDIDGALVGAASLKADEFAAIVKAAADAKRN
ncbi:triose-phosphate isomerase [Candidatus Fukatsuia symbiotica]|uniref:Triosephosphate isomerase n=1 Tax=Candidatus Fukatsuia symbiotica TaxID=1878942 RepID=A0A2U8IA99_9GAMM|nr:triose-phosphate isomerase [Candidatus Fukatsuia symbiotica]AWK15025.1 triose-phosphate isomerase [Candidatus Fukatsuia symbiotica]MEA9443825.1 triose-phosphate isomerase [Candidatus Fukatsuia symbiotica]